MNRDLLHNFQSFRGSGVLLMESYSSSATYRKLCKLKKFKMKKKNFFFWQTGLPRSARVHYVCYPNGKHEIYSFRESSSCEYEVIVLSNIICNHPDCELQLFIIWKLLRFLSLTRNYLIFELGLRKNYFCHIFPIALSAKISDVLFFQRK